MPRKKKPAPAPAPVSEDIFQHFARHTPGFEAGQDTLPGAGAGEGTKTVDMNTVLARLDALETQNRDLREQNQRLALPTAPAGNTNVTNAIDPATLRVSFDGLPDPLTDRTAYEQQLQTRINAVMDARDHALRTESETRANQSNQSDMLWNRFTSLHPEWTEHQEVVGAVAAKVVRDMQARGLNAQQYMTAYPDMYLADVHKELNSKYARLVADDEGEEEEPTQNLGRPHHGSSLSGDDDDGRTGGIFGGLESGGKPSAGAKDPKAGDMIKDLQDVQRKTGFF